MKESAYEFIKRVFTKYPITDWDKSRTLSGAINFSHKSAPRFKLFFGVFREKKTAGFFIDGISINDLLSPQESEEFKNFVSSVGNGLDSRVPTVVDNQMRQKLIESAADLEDEGARCSDSYVRLRYALKDFGALDTNFGGENRFEVTEAALDKALEELRRIKYGIKHAEVTMIIDGNDMADWGWMTHESHNQRMREDRKKYIEGVMESDV